MFPENPFFTLELRRRRNWGRIHRVAFNTALVASIPAMVKMGCLLLGNSPSWMPLLWSGVTALLLVGAGQVGILGGAQITSLERTGGTLDSVRLLPIPAWRWLFGKLAYPLLLLLVVPAATLPGALLASALGVVPWERARDTLFYLAAMGYFWATLDPMISGLPSSSGPSRTSQPLPWREQLRMLGEVGLYLPHLFLGAGAPLFLLVPGQLDRHGRCFFFATRVPLWWMILPVLICGSGFALVGTWRMLSGTPTAMQTAQRVVWAAFLVEGVLLAGAIGWQTWIYAWPLILPFALPLAQLIPSRKVAPRRREKRFDSRLESELAWLEVRFPNQVFLEDIRLYLKHGSLRGLLVMSLLALPIIAALLVLVITIGPYSPQGTTTLLLGISSVMFLLSWMLVPSTATVNWWQRPGNGELLNLSPISSREWIEGQAAASFLLSLCKYWTVALLMIGSLLWMLTTPHWGLAAPGLLTIVATMLSGPNFFGLPAIRLHQPKSPGARRPGPASLFWAKFGVLLMIALGLTIGAFSSSAPWAGWVALVLSVGGLPLPALLLRAVLRQRTAELELVRRGEAEWKLLERGG